MTRKDLKHIPSIDLLLREPVVQELIEHTSRGEIKMALQLVIDEVRRKILDGTVVADADLGKTITGMLEMKIRKGHFSTLRRTINATGVIIHTNLGRSLLCRQALDAIKDISGGYCSLEYDLDQGIRGSRYVHCEDLVRRITGAEAALIVNNNAAAVTLALNTFSEGKEAVVSRGELVEIGGSFRMPDIMAKSCAIMIEVGTTNKTRISDYLEAVSERTGVLVKVHRSNFDVSGFVDEVLLEDLAVLGRERSIPVMYDQGSGLLLDLDEFGIAGEPTIPEEIRKGASIVCFSGDKLLGGPQAGIVTGNKESIRRILKNPLTRTYRVDKFTLAALEATLKLYLEPEKALREIPVLRMLTATKSELEKRGKRIFQSLSESIRTRVSLTEVTSEVGGGSLPSVTIPSIALSISPGGERVNDLERAARMSAPPVIGRIARDRFLLDLRTVMEAEDPEIISFLEELL